MGKMEEIEIRTALIRCEECPCKRQETRQDTRQDTQDSKHSEVDEGMQSAGLPLISTN